MKLYKKISIIIICSCVVILIMSAVIFTIYKNVTEITKEDMVFEFQSNKEYFNDIKDYMLSQDNVLYLKADTYKSEIKDEKTKDSFKFIFDEMHYKYIRNTTLKNNNIISVIFARGGNFRDEFGIEYIGDEGSSRRQFYEYLGDGWYFYWIGYT